jgi:hypothetical protein
VTGRVTIREGSWNPESGLFARKIRDREKERFEKWRKASDRRVGGEDLLVYLRMLDDSGSQNKLLLNEGGNGAATPGAPVISANWVKGRWPGKRALLFQSMADRIRVSIKGRYPQATFAAWVQVAEFQRHFNALFMSEAPFVGEVHWQLSESGGQRFGVRPIKPRDGHFLRAFTDDLLPPSGWGTWRHLATTYDAGKRLVIHYLDGREVARQTLRESVPLVFGRATIGNSPVPPLSRWGSRQFGGAIDEFALFSRALEPSEIRDLYEEGRPE